MFARSHKLRATGHRSPPPWPLQRSQSQPRLTPAPCTPPAGADGWYCAALSTNNAGTANSVTDRLVDDFSRPARVDESSRPLERTAGTAPLSRNTPAPPFPGRPSRLRRVSAPTSEGIVDDSWRSPFVVEGAQQSSGGFNWGDFGIGVAVAVGAMLLAMGVSKRVKGQRRLGIGRA